MSNSSPKKMKIDEGSSHGSEQAMWP